MSSTEDSDSEYPEGTPVMVRYPAPASTPRDAWPWMTGTVEAVCGPGEWLVCVTSRDVATEEDGSPGLPGTSDDDLYFPMCFRDASEIKAAGE